LLDEADDGLTSLNGALEGGSQAVLRTLGLHAGEWRRLYYSRLQPLRHQRTLPA
jgi:hypothetical protein